MSLKPDAIQPIPEETARVARAAFPRGNALLTLRDELGTIFRDEDFIGLFPVRGQPALSPWRLALVTLLQFRENLSDRQAAEAVRSRIDWKYLLGLELTDPGFDFSVLSEFRDRLLAGGAAEILLEKLLERSRELGLLQARGQQRTDATHVLAAIRLLNRLELVGETLRAALNQLAAAEPEWLRRKVPAEWYKRYGRRLEEERLPKGKAERQAYGQRIGEDGFMLLDWLAEADAPPGLQALPQVHALRMVWARHFERQEGRIDFKSRWQPQEGLAIESPYDVEARYRERSGTKWTGYLVHLSESCEEKGPYLLTHVLTTEATVHEARCTARIQEALVEKGLAPGQHLVDSAYVDAALLVRSQQEQGITLVGPTRPNSSWQAQVEGAYDREQFAVDWEKKQATCPQGKRSQSWREHTDRGTPYIQVTFAREDCQACGARSLCTKGKERRLRLQPRAQYEALQATRQFHASKEGQQLYAKRAGVEGTISQGVRAFGLRRTRYRGLAKTHLQHVATAAAVNLERLAAWFDGIPRAETRTSRFAALPHAA